MAETDSVAQWCGRIRWAVTTEAECVGLPPSEPERYALYDADEDDPPIAVFEDRDAALMVAEALNRVGAANRQAPDGDIAASMRTGRGLRELCAAAIPGGPLDDIGTGEWEAWFNFHGDPFVTEKGRGQWGIVATVGTGPEDYGRSRAEFIAAANPKVVLELLDRIDNDAMDAREEAELRDLYDVPRETPGSES